MPKSFARGNQLATVHAVTHGAYVSPVRLSPRADELADEIRPYLPAQSPGYEPALACYCLILCRVERAAQGVYAHPDGDQQSTRLLNDLRKWLMASLRYASELGLTPASQARLFRDSGIGRSATASAALREHLEANYGQAEIE
jgi:hypothetical protein